MDFHFLTVKFTTNALLHQTRYMVSDALRYNKLDHGNKTAAASKQ
jgi:hypothetical protein